MDPESLNRNKPVYDSNIKNSDKKSWEHYEKVAEIFEDIKKKLENSKEVKYFLKNANFEKMTDDLWNLIDKIELQKETPDFYEKMIDDFLNLIAKLEPHEEVVDFYKKLINDGPIKKNYGTSVLHLAALSDNELLIKHLLRSDEKKKDNLKEGDINKQTPLHYAAKGGAKKAVACLIENDADKEAKDYIGRTPLYLAAEYGQEETVKLLKDKGCEVNVKNKNGQKALYWIIAKCRNLAMEILDSYRTINKYYYIETYNLKAVELELMDINKNPTVKSILELIVEQYDTELIMHPVIKKLIEYKWKHLYFLLPFLKFILDLFLCVSWNFWSVLIPYNERHIYNFPQETWRIILFVFGIFEVIIITLEYKKFSNREHKEKIATTRSEEIAIEKKAFPCNETRIFLENERSLNNEKPFINRFYFFDRYQQYKKSKETNNYVYIESKSIKSSYSIDEWDYLNLITIVLITFSLVTHLIDVLNHSETTARNHIRVASITVVVQSFRILKSARTFWMPLGLLVMTLYHIIKDIIVWTFAFIIIWISFTTCFYMLFGNGLTIDCDSTTQTCSAENKTVISEMEDYGKAAFFLFTAAFAVADIPYEQFNELDKMSNYIVGLYIGVVTVIMVNIFIALLSRTFERVHEYSIGELLIKRAKKIIQVELLYEKFGVRPTNFLRQTPLKYIAEYRPKDSRDDIEPKINLLRIINNNIKLNLSNIDDKIYDKIKNFFKDLNVKPQMKTRKHQVDVLYLNNIEDMPLN